MKAIEIKFEITEVLNRTLRQIAGTQESVSHTYHAIKTFSADSFPALETHTLPTVVIDPMRIEKPEGMKERTLCWLFKNAFEEFILGLSESLIEAYRFIKLKELADRSRSIAMSLEDIEQEQQRITMRSMAMHFPVLLEAVEKQLGRNLSRRNEVLSVNRVRNCLVHRNGRVSIKDVEQGAETCLMLSYVDPVVLLEKDGHVQRLTRELKEQHKDGMLIDTLHIDQRPTTVRFAIGEDVMIDQDVFNGVAWTCIDFAQQLFAEVRSLVPASAINTK